MRILKTSLLVLVSAFFAVAQAQAVEFSMSSTYGGETLDVSDTVVVDVFLDTEVGMQIFGVGVTFDATELSYDSAGTIALPPQGPGSSGAQPSYILYTAGGGMSPTTTLYPLQTPAFQTWPTPPAGAGQVNVNYSETAFNPAAASGTNVYIGSLLLEVISTGDGSAEIDFRLEDSGGQVVRINDVELDLTTVPLNGAPITVVTAPEPAQLGLGVSALVVTAWLVRRRRA